MNLQKKMRYLLIIRRLILFCGIVFPLCTFAVSNKTTYQAKIIKPDGNPLEATSVNFKFTILDPSASCILYAEEYSAVNMNGTSGLIFFSLGSGNRTYPASGGSTLASVFDNSVVSFPCQSPGLYPPTFADNRKIVMQFNDGTGWQTLPAMAINSVPFSMYAGKADNSTQLNGKSDTAFVEKSTLAALNCNSVTHAITFNGVSFSCIPVGSGSGGGIISVTTSGTVLSAGGSASAPVISITAVSMSSDGYLTSLDYAEFKAKLSASSTQIISTLGYSPVSGAAVATQINNSNLSGDVSGTISSNSVIGVGGKTASQISISVEDTLAATASSTADTIVKRNSSGNATFNDIYANSAKLNYVDIYKPSKSFNIRLQAPTSLSTNYVLNLPTTSGAVGQVLSTDGAGNLSWVNPSTGSVTSVSGTASEITSTGGVTPTLGLANIGTVGTYYKVITDNKGRVTSGATTLLLSDLPNTVLNTTSAFAGDVSGIISNIIVNRIQGMSVTVTSLTANDILQYDGSKYVNRNIPICVGNQYLTFNGTSFSCVFDAGASGTVASISVTGPISSTGGSNPTLSIAQATSGIDGYLSSTDWNTFNNKLSLVSATASFLQKTGDTMAGLLALQAGTTANAPLKFTSGTLLSSAQSGTIEYDGSQLYFTDGASIRRAIATNSSQGSFDNTSSISNTSGNITLSPNNITGSVIVNSSQASISSGTGALVVNGGLGVAGNINAGGNLNLSGSANIGQSLQLPSMTSGSLLFAGASGLVSEDNSRLFWDGANKRLGIGSNSPVQTLSVSGASYFSGNVGIGVTNPGQKFMVDGNAEVLAGNYFKLWSPDNTSNSLTFSATNSAASISQSSGPLYIHSLGFEWANDDKGGATSTITNSGETTRSLTLTTSNLKDIFIKPAANTLITNGNVGIGVTNPSAKLELASGTASLAPLKFTSGTLLSSAQSGSFEYDGFNFYVTDSTNTRRAIAANTNPGTYDNVSNINSSSNITMTPNTSVIVSATTASTNTSTGALVVKGGAGIAGDLNVGGTVNMASSLTVSGNVGIGMTTPTEILIANGSINSNNQSNNFATGGVRVMMDMVNASKIARIGTVTGGDVLTGTQGELSLYVNSVERMRLNASGNIGIGTVTPNEKLDLSTGATYNTVNSSGVKLGNSNADSVDNGKSSYYVIKPSGNATGVRLDFIHNTRLSGTSFTGETSVMSLVNGNVGVGTISPAQKLEVNGGIKITGVGQIGPNGTYGYGLFQNGTSTFVGQMYGIASGIQFTDSAGANTMTIKDGGSVGIGTTTPGAQLDISNSSMSALRLSSTAAGGKIWEFDSEANGVFSVVDRSNSVRRISAASGDYITFYKPDGSTSMMHLTGAGNVGIGTTDPDTKFHVVGDTEITPSSGTSAVNATSTLRFKNVNLAWGSGGSQAAMIQAITTSYINDGSTANALAFSLANTGSNAAAEMMRIQSNGNVGIGTNSPVAKLHVTDSIALGSGGTFDLSVFPANNPGAHNSGTVPTTMSFGGSARVTYNAVRNLANTFNDEFLTFSTHRGGISQGERMRIDPIGNVGIGTTNPGRKLQIHESSGGPSYLQITASSTGVGSMDGLQLAIDGSTSDAGIIQRENSLLYLSTNNTPRLYITGDGNVGIGTSTPSAKLDVAGEIKLGNTASTCNASNEGQQRYNSTVKLMEYCNGSAWYPMGGGPGQIISKTIQKNCTRWVVVPTTSIIFESFTVNKKYASSTLLIEGTISGFAGYSGSMQQQWKYGAGAEVAAQGIMYEPSAHGRIFSTAAVIEGHTTTGAQTMLFKYYSAAGTDKPFLVYNPSASDDTRLTQTCSIYVVSEVAQ